MQAPGKADLNVYAYVHGAILQAIDPLGLQGSGAEPGMNPGNVSDPQHPAQQPAQNRADTAPAPGPSQGSMGAGGGGPGSGPKLTPTKAPPQENLHVDAHPEMYGGTEGAGGETHGGPPNANKSETPSGVGLAIGIASVVDPAALELEDASLAADATADAIAGRSLTKDVLLGTSETEGASAGAAVETPAQEPLRLTEPQVGEGTGWSPKQSSESLLSGPESPSNSFHGNSKTSTKPQHVYEINRTDAQGNTEVYKYGISGGKITRAGESYRAGAQVRQLNKAAQSPGPIHL